MATEYGDFTGFLSGNQKGEDNTLNGIDNESNTLIGDVDDMDEAQGGDDELTGGDNSGGGTVFNELSDDEAHEVQQRDMLILWERSNEFELIHGPANLRSSESHSQSV